ncbi:mycothiol synthase [Propionibacteriaceae bacterium Y2011]
MTDVVASVDRLDPDQVAGVRSLLSRCTEADGVAPLNEDARLALDGSPGDTVRHVVAHTADGELIAYATVHGTTAQLAVDPAHRRRGLGSRLVAAVGPAHWWAFGNLPGAQGLAARLGYVITRELLVLERPVTGLGDPRPIPDTVAIRAFEAGRDEEAWLAVNARSFADHPEQGRTTAADLAARMAEPWFDPAGFLLAVDPAEPDRVLGFHWTKIDPAAPEVGEVYVLGVDPEAAGGGLGGVLLDAGLGHLVGRGVTTIELYVEGDNTRALRLYERAGFTVANRDVTYAEPEQDGTPAERELSQ